MILYRFVRFWHFCDMPSRENEGRFQPGSGHRRTRAAGAPSVWPPPAEGGIWGCSYERLSTGNHGNDFSTQSRERASLGAHAATREDFAAAEIPSVSDSETQSLSLILTLILRPSQ
jgi:hypothetical protein